jgi:integrase/recombinase XerD
VGNDDLEVYLKLSGLAASTRETYRFYIGTFLAWSDDRQQVLADVTAYQLVDWVEAHAEWKSAARYCAVTAIKGFYRYRFGASHDIPQHARVRREESGPQRSLEAYQLEKVLESLDVSKPKGIRDRSIIALMVDTGLRVAELCRLELKYLNRKKRKLSVVVKGGGWEDGDYFDRSAEYLEEWLHIRDEFALPGVKTVYVSIGGNKHGTNMTPGGLRANFRYIGGDNDLELSPHDLRRTFACLSAINGASAPIIQKAGRWKTLEMVLKYTRNLKPSDLKPYSPMDRLGKG